MILQTDTRLNAFINDSGCNFMSILYHAVRYTGLRVSVKHIEDLYDDAIRSGVMDIECYINDYDKLFRIFGMETKYTGVHEKPSRRCSQDEIEILCFYNPSNKFTHFVAGDGAGNVMYDPIGLSRTVREGYLKSKRIFKVKG